MAGTERVDVLVVGGGQAGLAMGFFLQRSELSFLVVDRNARTGDSWRQRWDTLRLFTPRFLCSLPGLPAPASLDYYPTRTQIADYLESYAHHFGLPVRHDCELLRLTSIGDGFLAQTSRGRVLATDVVIATGAFVAPAVPAFAAGLDQGVWQRHSSQYRAPRDVPRGSVLVVGGGNSGAQLAEELCATHRVTLASSGPLLFAPRTVLGASIFRFLEVSGLLTADRDVRFSGHAQQYDDTIIGLRLRTLIKQRRLRHVPQRVVAADGRHVELADGARLPVSAVLWCTGFRPGYDWLAVDGALDERGAPVQDRGVSPVPGLYWLGLPWQNRLNSALLNGVAFDAAQLSARLTRRNRTRPAESSGIDRATARR